MALKDVLLDELRDLYSAENQLVKTLPKLAKGANDETLSTLFTEHLEETRGQIDRLKQIFESLDEKPTGKHCNGMEGLIEEGEEALEEDAEGASFDLGLTGGALRVEHYEIAGYTTVIAMAKQLGLTEVTGLLQQSLTEEQNAAKKIIAASAPLLEQAAEEPEEEDEPMDAKEKAAARKSKEDEKKAAPELKKRKTAA